MVKEMRVDSNPLAVYKQRHWFVKFAVSFLLMGLAFRLFFSSDSFVFSTELETTSTSIAADQETESPVASSPNQTPLPLDFPENESQMFQNGKQRYSFCLFLFSVLLFYFIFSKS